MNNLWKFTDSSNRVVSRKNANGSESCLASTLSAEELMVALPADPIAQDVPQAVSKFQAKAALLDAGRLAQVEALMASQSTPAIAKLAWTDAQNFERNSPTIAALAAALGLSSEQIDNLFIAAARITA